jgi:hypothetical protein
MKLTKKALLAATPVFHHNFDSAADVFKEFEVGGLKRYYWGDDEDTAKDAEPKRIDKLCKKYKILYADYTGGYEGDAYVLGYDTEEKKFFEVHGSHCSCYGLEDQWDAEYCTIDELKEIVERRFVEKEEHTWMRKYAHSSTRFENWLKNVTEGK